MAACATKSLFHKNRTALVKYRCCRQNLKVVAQREPHTGAFHSRTRPRLANPPGASSAHPHPSSLHVLTRAQRTHLHFCPRHWLLCHLGLYKFEFEQKISSKTKSDGVSSAHTRSDERRKKRKNHCRGLAFRCPMIVCARSPSFLLVCSLKNHTNIRYLFFGGS